MRTAVEKYLAALDAFRTENSRGVYGRAWKDMSLKLEIAEEHLRAALTLETPHDPQPR
jgi:hypothetical protein